MSYYRSLHITLISINVRLDFLKLSFKIIIYVVVVKMIKMSQLFTRSSIPQIQVADFVWTDLDAILEVEAFGEHACDSPPLIVEAQEKVLVDVGIARCARGRVLVQEQWQATLVEYDAFGRDLKNVPRALVTGRGRDHKKQLSFSRGGELETLATIIIIAIIIVIQRWVMP